MFVSRSFKRINDAVKYDRSCFCFRHVQIDRGVSFWPDCGGWKSIHSHVADTLIYPFEYLSNNRLVNVSLPDNLKFG